MLKRILAVALSSVMVMSLVGCGGGAKETAGQPTKSSDGKTVIKFFHRWPNEPRNSYFKELVAEFEKQNPDIKVETDAVLNDSYKEKIRVLVSSDNVPDVFVSWSDSFAENLVASGKVKPLNDIVEKDKEWASQVMDSQKGAFTFDGKLYGMPLTIDGKAFFYNKDVFEKNGLSVPKTFDELIALLEKLKTLGYKAPIIEGLTDPWTIAHYLGTMNQRMLEPAVLKKDYNAKTGEFTNPAYVKVLEHFKTLTKYMGTTATAIDHETARNMFASGEVPVMYMQLAEIKKVQDNGDIKFGFFNFPTFADGKGSPEALTGAPEGFMLSNVSKNPEAAEKLLKFIISKENATKFTKLDGQVTAIKGAVSADNASKEILEAVDLIMNSSETTPWLDNAVKISVADAYMRGGQSIAAGQKTPQDVMKDVQKAAAEERKSAK